MGACAVPRMPAMRHVLVKLSKMTMGVILFESIDGIHLSPCVCARELGPSFVNLVILRRFPLKVLLEII